MWHLLRSGVWEATYGDGNWELVPESGLNYFVFRRLKSPRRNHCEGDFWPSTKHKTKLILKANETACLIYVYMTARRSAEYLRFESWDLTKRSVVNQNNSLGLWLNDSFFLHIPLSTFLWSATFRKLAVLLSSEQKAPTQVNPLHRAILSPINRDGRRTGFRNVALHKKLDVGRSPKNCQ